MHEQTLHQYMKCRSSKPTLSRNTAVRQQTRTVKVPTVLPCGRSKLTWNHMTFYLRVPTGLCQAPQPVEPHGLCRPLWIVLPPDAINWLTIPKVPHTASIWRITLLRHKRDKVKSETENNSPWWMRMQGIGLTATCSLELPDAHLPLFADKQKLHHTYDLCALPVCIATYQAVQSTPFMCEWMSVI